MSYSVSKTRRRLPFLYLAIAVAVAIRLLLPDYPLIGPLPQLFLLPLWVFLGHVLVGTSYVLTGLSLRRGRILFRSSLQVYGRWGEPVHVQAAFLIALAEEMVFRYAALFWFADLLNGEKLALLVTSVLFSLAHLRFGFRLKHILHYFDLFVFALVVGALVLWTRSLLPALIVHGMRNYILRCLLVSREEYELRQRKYLERRLAG